MNRRVLAFAGPSGSGKTTAIVAAIRELASRGVRVSAIKHTHHPLNEERRGDTAAFADAGADPVILAGEGEAVIFHRDAIAVVSYESPEELLGHCQGEVVLVEGFKGFSGWPRIEVERGRAVEVSEVVDKLIQA